RVFPAPAPIMPLGSGRLDKPLGVASSCRDPPAPGATIDPPAPGATIDPPAPGAMIEPPAPGATMVLPAPGAMIVLPAPAAMILPRASRMPNERSGSAALGPAPLIRLAEFKRLPGLIVMILPADPVAISVLPATGATSGPPASDTAVKS